MSADDRWRCSDDCSGCWQEDHDGHDVATTHSDGWLYSATCHDCNATWSRPAAEGLPDAGATS